MTSFTDVDKARAAIGRVIRDGEPPNGIQPADCGDWHPTVQAVYDAFADGGIALARMVWGTLVKAESRLGALLAEDPGQPDDPAARRVMLAALAPSSSFCELPAEVQFALEVGADASPWLDAYIEHSRRWSPRAYDGFHVAVGLWLLSTVAARRVVLDLGGPRYTNLYLTLCARTSLYAKSTTAKIGQQVLADAGLKGFLAPDDSTPQAFKRGMALRLAGDYAEMPEEKRTAERNRLAFASSRGWFHEEFGQKISAMMRENGVMADFRGDFRRFDDCPEEYRSDTIARGEEYIERPYVALLANLTPDDLAPHAKRGASLWGDGFLARFALVAPPPNVAPSTARFPRGERITPPGLVHPLRDWHERLGLPTVTVTPRSSDAKGKPTYDVGITRAQGQRCTLAPEVEEGFYAYNDALLELAGASEQHDLDGNYARNAEKALRVAMLLASLENQGRIERRHWARAQAIAEGWRYELHSLVDGLASHHAANSREQESEEKVIRVVARGVPMTAREVGLYAHLSSAEANQILEHLTRMGEVSAEKIGKALRYASVASVAVASVASPPKVATLPISKTEPAKCSKDEAPCYTATLATLATLPPPDAVSPEVRARAESVLAQTRAFLATPKATPRAVFDGFKARHPGPIESEEAIAEAHATIDQLLALGNLTLPHGIRVQFAFEADAEAAAARIMQAEKGSRR